MSVKDSLRRGVAGAGVAGLLTVGLLAGQAAPAQAILPIVPVVVGAVGGTAVTGAISGWALAGYAALTTATLALAGAIQQNGNVWIQQAVDFFEPQEEIKVQSTTPDPGGSTKTDGSYVWKSSTILVESWTAAQVLHAGAPRPSAEVQINLKYTLTFWGDPNARLAWVADITCKPYNGGPTFTETRYMAQGILQPAAGYNTYTVKQTCGNSNLAELMEARIRPPNTQEKNDPAKFGMQPGQGWYDEFMFADAEVYWKNPDLRYADPGYRATVECVSTAGVKTSLSLDSAYSPDGQIGIPSCKAAGLGDVANSLKIDYIDGTRTVTPAIRTVPNSDQFLECDAAFGNFCKLEIYIDGMPCVVGTVQCAGWVSQHLANPARVKCFYGTREVSISNCGVLEGAYIYGGSPATSANTDGDPNTWDDPRKVPGWSPSIEPGGSPAPATQPNPNVEPDPGTDPGTEPGTDPGTDPDPGTEPGTNPDGFPNTGTNPDHPDFLQCLGSGWSWNPVSWVMVPMQCVLQWAFVPPKARIDAAVQSIQPKLDARGIAPFVQPIVAGVSGLGGGGCAGPAIDLSVIKLPVFYPFSACAAPMSTIASAVNSFFALSLVVQGGMSCIRGVASAFGFNWGLGSKGDD